MVAGIAVKEIGPSKNSAIRQIMRNRRSRSNTGTGSGINASPTTGTTATTNIATTTATQLLVPSQSLDDNNQKDTVAAVTDACSSDPTTTRTTGTGIPSSLPHAVSLDEDNLRANPSGHSVKNLTRHSMSNNIDKGESELPEQQPCAAFFNGSSPETDRSLSSSNWMILQHGLDSSPDPASQWQQPELLMGTSILSFSSDNSLFPSVSGDCEINNSSVEPNVSWSDNTNSNDDPNHEHGPDSTEGDMPHLSSQQPIILPPPPPTELSNNDDDFSSSPTATDEGDEGGSAPLLELSPFRTYRHNSTSIALHETKVYARKIQSLERELTQARKARAATQDQQQQHETTTLHPADELEQLRALPSSSAASFRTPSHHGNTNNDTQNPSSTYHHRTPFSTSTTNTQFHSTTSFSSNNKENLLWERNKTLVTEIRFADQTCVELATQKAALENELAQLQLRWKQQQDLPAAQALSGLVAAAECFVEHTHTALQTWEPQQPTPVGSVPTPATILSMQLKEFQRKIAAAAAAGVLASTMEQQTERANQSPNQPFKNADMDEIVQQSHTESMALRNELASSKETNQCLYAQITGLTEEVEQIERELMKTYRLIESLENDLDDMARLRAEEHAEVAHNMGRVVNLVHEQSSELTAQFVDRVLQLEQKLDSCGVAVLCLGSAAVDTDQIGSDDNDTTSSDCVEMGDDIVERNSKVDLHVSFPPNDQSMDLAQMEEARGGALDSKRHGVSEELDVWERSAVTANNNAISGQFTSPTLSDDHNSAPRARSFHGNLFQHHVQWLSATSPTQSQARDRSCSVDSSYPVSHVWDNGNTAVSQWSDSNYGSVGSISRSEANDDYVGRIGTRKADKSNRISLLLQEQMQDLRNENMNLVSQLQTSRQKIANFSAPDFSSSINRYKTAHEDKQSSKISSPESIRVHFGDRQREANESVTKERQLSVSPKHREPSAFPPKSQLVNDRDELFDQLASLRRDKRLADTELQALNSKVDIVREENALQLTQSQSTIEKITKERDELMTKCNRLREYVRKLAKKCDEWEEFSASESNAVQHLQNAYDCTLMKVSELTTSCEIRHNMYSVEKKKVAHLEEARDELENELVTVARKLSNLTSNPI